MTKKQFMDTNRIYVVVTPMVKIGSRVVQMETGRMMAQACHAASKAKFQFVFRQKKKLKDWIIVMTDYGLTTIILKARDQKELRHIFNLAEIKGLPTVEFYDDNEDFYEHKDAQLTAIAVGPICSDQSVNVCDYLPLFA